ncbi:hypothetical protein CFC21_095451 [Triticum aestivum]|uniref:protein-serine/threonine phosphatase n=2 Tax=Triticum aestivum TaxID=4565 RepID=A0A3B6RBE6_WHEAT|nr:hypothetical protein CFC21_095451 [Triticum aestivum]
MHFFAFMDGHGGLKLSALCREQMHTILVEELAGPENDEEAECHAWEVVLNRGFERADALGIGLSELGWPIVGCTAVVALLHRGSILVINCGDSRAMLCSAGDAIPLSEDQR